MVQWRQQLHQVKSFLKIIPTFSTKREARGKLRGVHVSLHVRDDVSTRLLLNLGILMQLQWIGVAVGFRQIWCIKPGWLHVNAPIGIKHGHRILVVSAQSVL